MTAQEWSEPVESVLRKNYRGSMEGSFRENGTEEEILGLPAPT